MMQVYQIYDTVRNEYVVKNTYSLAYTGFTRSQKYTWKQAGHAKRACVEMIKSIVRGKERWHNSDLIKLFPDVEKVNSFKDQTRFEVHEMELVFKRKCD